MVRISHMASYFMPLFCSSKPHIVSLTVIITGATFATFYWTSKLLLNEYDDPMMFKPNSQDYFRSSLLGLFSPFLYYFIKVFLLNINNTYVIGNIITDFLINDWFMLCILVMLSYPQLQEPIQRSSTLIANTNHSPSSKYDNSMEQWHIIPKQSYIFGISWSLGELIVCLIANVFNYQEASPLENNDSIEFVNSNTENNLNSDQLIDRKEITLAKCVGLRRNSSSISSNIYYDELEPLIQLKQTYNKAEGYGTKYVQGANNKFKSFANIVMVDPIDNSLRFSSSDIEEGWYQRNSPRPVLERRYGFTWIKYISSESQFPSFSDVKLYIELNSWKENFKSLLQYYLILSMNILYITGQSFFLSIYFIYVRGHERLFTKVVNYFGNKNIEIFLLVLITPLSIINFCMSIFVFLCNDVLEWVNLKLINQDLNNIKYSFYPRVYQNHHIYLQDSRSSQSLDLNDSQVSTTMYPNFTQELNDTTEKGKGGNFTKYYKRLLRKWEKAAIHTDFILTNVIIWSISLFVIGILSAVKFSAINN